MTAKSPARVRFAPSPTGRFHIGGARTSLYDYLLARQTGGQFVLRIEDTDRRRFDPNAEKEIIDALHWLGLQWDEGPDIGGPYGPYRQSERRRIYEEHAERLVHSGHAYYCFCSPERLSQVRQLQQKRKEPPHYDGLCRALAPSEARRRVDQGEGHVIRFRTPKEGETTGVDLLRGEITVENATIDDYILMKSNGLPVYHLAAMVDDHLMEITHVLRGSEWLPTFPLHVMIYQAFQWKQPVWVHLSVLLNPSGKGKLSKRAAVNPKAGAKAVFALDLRELGYLPEAVNNWVALMGWSYDDHTEWLPMDELIEKFTLERLNPSPAAVNFSKLDHFNGQYIRRLPIEELAARLGPFFAAQGIQVDEDLLLRICPIIQERMRTLDEGPELAGFFFCDDVEPDPQDLIGKKMTIDQSAQAAEQAARVISELEAYEHEPLEDRLRALADDLGLKAGQLFGILRSAVTGQRVSPPLIETMIILGRETTVARIEHAVQLLRSMA